MMMHLVIIARTGLLIFTGLEELCCRVIISDYITFLGLIFTILLNTSQILHYTSIVETFVQNGFTQFFQKGIVPELVCLPNIKK